MQESDIMSKEEQTIGEPKGKTWMESKHWQESQPKPKHRKAEVPGIQGVRHIVDDERVVTDVKMKFKKERS
jgi:hypothetical protein